MQPHLLRKSLLLQQVFDNFSCIQVRRCSNTKEPGEIEFRMLILGNEVELKRWSALFVNVSVISGAAVLGSVFLHGGCLVGY